MFPVREWVGKKWQEYRQKRQVSTELKSYYKANRDFLSDERRQQLEKFGAICHIGKSIPKDLLRQGFKAESSWDLGNGKYLFRLTRS